MRPQEARSRWKRLVPCLCIMVFAWACDCKNDGGSDVTLDIHADDSRQDDSEGENGEEHDGCVPIP